MKTIKELNYYSILNNSSIVLGKSYLKGKTGHSVVYCGFVKWGLRC